MSKSVGCVAWRGYICIYIEGNASRYRDLYICICIYLYMNTPIFDCQRQVSRHVQERRVRGLERGGLYLYIYRGKYVYI